MLIRFLGTGDASRSFIEPIQRYVDVGEVVRVKKSIADGLLATGRWREANECGGTPSGTPPANPTPKSEVAGKGSPRRTSRSSGKTTKPSETDNPERQLSKSEVSR